MFDSRDLTVVVWIVFAELPMLFDTRFWGCRRSFGSLTRARGGCSGQTCMCVGRARFAYDELQCLLHARPVILHCAAQAGVPINSCTRAQTMSEVLVVVRTRRCAKPLYVEKVIARKLEGLSPRRVLPDLVILRGLCFGVAVSEARDYPGVLGCFGAVWLLGLPCCVRLFSRSVPCVSVGPWRSSDEGVWCTLNETWFIWVGKLDGKRAWGAAHEHGGGALRSCMSGVGEQLANPST